MSNHRGASDDAPDVSLIFPVCNQGDWARRTIPQAIESLGRLSYEVLVVDDHSTDGCCQRLGEDVTVLHPDIRAGVSGARRMAADMARGQVLIFSDPHCEYRGDSLQKIAKIAAKSHSSIVQPRTKHKPNASKTWAGSTLVTSDRGLITKPVVDVAEHPALYNTIYAIKRETYDRIGGWPLLPGVWGGSEQAMSLLAWFLGVTIEVCEDAAGVHFLYQDNRKFPFSVSKADTAKNAHYVHAAFFPNTYPHYWKPILDKYYGADGEYSEETKAFNTFKRFVRRNRIPNEKTFFRDVLGIPFPHDKNTPPAVSEADRVAFETDQRRRATPQLHPEATPRINRSIHWMIQTLPGCLRGRKVIDLGTRDGFTVNRLIELGAAVAVGVEVVEDTAKFASKNTGGKVRHGDMRCVDDVDNTWDIVSSIHSLEHVPNPLDAMNEMVRILKPHGWLFVVVPLEETPSKTWAHNTCFASAEEFLAMVAKCDSLDQSTIATSVVKYSASGNEECRLLVRKVGKQKPTVQKAKKPNASEGRFHHSKRNPDCRGAHMWSSLNGSTVETEVGELVAAFARGLQPELVVETGTCEGRTSRLIGHKLHVNGHGRLVTFEIDKERASLAVTMCRRLPVEVIESPVWEWQPEDGEIIGYAFFDAKQTDREREFKHLRPWMDDKTIVAFHDTSPLKRGRRGVESLVKLGLISPLYLPTPRGICFARVL